MSADLRVVHLGPDPGLAGGMAAVTRSLIAARTARGGATTAISTYRGPGRQQARVFPAALIKLAAWCLRPGHRVAHIHVTVRGSAWRKAICVTAARALRCPVVLHVHAGADEILGAARTMRPPIARALARALARADAVVAVSSATRDAAGRCLGRDDIAVVINPAPNVDAVRATDSGPGGVEVLYLGGFADPVKGGITAVQALRMATDEAPSLRATIAGPGQPPSESTALFSDRAAWVGALSPAEAHAALARADLFLLPSLSEGLPVALLEALALGSVVVATRVGGVPDVIRDGEDGVLVPPGDADALAAAVVSLAAAPDDRVRLAAAGQRRAEALSPARVAERFEAIYDGVTSS